MNSFPITHTIAFKRYSLKERLSSQDNQFMKPKIELLNYVVSAVFLQPHKSTACLVISSCGLCVVYWSGGG